MNQEEEQGGQEMPEEEPTEGLEEPSKIYTCKYCGAEFPSIPLLGTHSKSCTERLKALEKKMEESAPEQETPETPLGGVPPLEKSGMTPTEYVAYYGVDGMDELKRLRLNELLVTAPSVGRRTVTWINKQWQLDPSVRRDLNQLLNVLTGSGVKQDIAYRICSVLQAMEDEYADVLRRQAGPYAYYPRRDEGRGVPPFPSGYSQQAPSRFEPFPRYPQPAYPPYDYGGYSPYGYQPPRPEDIARRVAEELKKETQQQQAQAQPQIVTITEPLRDAEGKLVYDREGNPVYRKIVGPLGQVGAVSQEDPELKFMRKMKEWRDLTKPERPELSEERIRNIIREETAKKEEPITKEDVLTASREAAASVLAAKETEDREEKRFERLERAIRESSAAKAVEGYHADEYRLLGQGMQTLATREPKTVRIIVEGVKDILYGPAPTRKEVEPGASEGIFERLDKKYVAED